MLRFQDRINRPQTIVIEPPIINQQAKAEQEYFQGKGEKVKSASKEINCSKINNYRICDQSKDCVWKGDPNTGICVNKITQETIREEIIQIARKAPIRQMVEIINTAKAAEDDEFKSFEDKDEFKSFEDKDEFKSFEDKDKFKSFEDEDEFKSFEDEEVLLEKAQQLEETVVKTNGNNNEINAAYITALTDVAIQPNIIQNIYNLFQRIFTNIPGAINTLVLALVDLAKTANNYGKEVLDIIYEFAEFVKELISKLVQGANNIEEIILNFFNKVNQWFNKIQPILKGSYDLIIVLGNFLVTLLKALFSITKITVKISMDVTKFIISIINLFSFLLPSRGPRGPRGPGGDEYIDAILPPHSPVRRKSSSNHQQPRIPPYLRKRDNLIIELRQQNERWGHPDVDVGKTPEGQRKDDVFRKGYWGGSKRQSSPKKLKRKY